MPIPFLYSSILIGIFCTSLTFQDRTPSPLPSPVLFFSCRLEASARGRWHRAGLLRRRGDYYLGCGRRRYCGRVCCLSRRRVLPQQCRLTVTNNIPAGRRCFLCVLDHIPRTNATFLHPSPSFSQNLKASDCIPGAMPPSSGVPRPHPYTQKSPASSYSKTPDSLSVIYKLEMDSNSRPLHYE